MAAIGKYFRPTRWLGLSFWYYFSTCFFENAGEHIRINRVGADHRIGLEFLNQCGQSAFDPAHDRGFLLTEIAAAGGHALFTDHIAAPGLFMEFADGLRTTRIRTVRWIAVEETVQ